MPDDPALLPRLSASAEALRLAAAAGRLSRRHIAAVQDAAALLDEVAGVVEALAERHSPYTTEAEFYCGDEEAFPEDAEGCPPRPGASCPDDCPGHIIPVEVCRDCGHDHDDGYPLYRAYPCPTRRALDGEAVTDNPPADDEPRRLPGREFTEWEMAAFAGLPPSFDEMAPVDVVAHLAAGLCDVPTPDDSGRALVEALRGAARLLGYQLATVPFGFDTECIVRLRSTGSDLEVDAAHACVSALGAIDPKAAARVVAYRARRFEPDGPF